MALSTPGAARDSFNGTNVWDRGIAALLWGAAVLVVLYGVFIIWRYAWLDIYADQWYIYGTLLNEPFPENALRAVNGHRIVFPNLIRLIELHWLGGDQTLQRVCGIAFTTGTVLSFWRVLGTEQGVCRAARGGAALAVGISVFWLANGRMLLHAAESTQIYLVFLMLGLAVLALAPAANNGTPSNARVWLAALCGVVAAMSFGYGIVLFPAALATLVIMRAPLRSMLPLVFGLGLALVLYLASPGAGGVREVVRVDILDNLSVGLRWLGVPVAQVLRPFIDPAHALAYLGEWWDEPLLDGARQFAANYGSIDQLFWLPLGTGIVGVGLALGYSWDAWRTRKANRVALVGLMLVWFGLSAAGVIALARADYFRKDPLQLAAERYLPMTTLFWAGLLLLALARMARSTPWSAWAHAKLVLTVALCAHVFATNANWRIWAASAQSSVRTQNIMLAVGVTPPASWLGETPALHMHASLPALRERGVALFGHPSVAQLDSTLRAAVDTTLGVGLLTITPIDNPGGKTAALVDIDMTAFQRSVRAPIWLLLDRQDRVLGLAAPHPLRSTRRLRGVVRGDGDVIPDRAVPWTKDVGEHAVAIALQRPAISATPTPAPR